ncbi:MAG: hypothetical protein Q9167_006375 [Letrouitia subvulpina]
MSGHPIRLQMQKLSIKTIFAGLATDCRSAFFCNDDKACIYRINNTDTLSAVSWFSEAFAPSIPQGCCILDAILSENYFAINARQRVLVFHNGVSSRENEILIDHRCNYGSSSCLALHEANENLLLAVGSSKVSEDDGHSKGYISVFRYDLSARRKNGTKLHSFSLAHNDIPKKVSFDLSGGILVCITSKFNTILAWQGIGTTKNPHQFIVSNTYGTSGEGVTSASVFTPLSGNPYLLCTTYASNDRLNNGGEWPYSTPILPLPTKVPPDAIHNFHALREQSYEVAGTASNQCNIFAVLNEQGKIYLLNLDSHEKGGIYSSDTLARSVGVSLHEQKEPMASCIRFDPSRPRFFAVDPKGMLIVIDFKKR